MVYDQVNVGHGNGLTPGKRPPAEGAGPPPPPPRPQLRLLPAALGAVCVLLAAAAITLGSLRESAAPEGPERERAGGRER